MFLGDLDICTILEEDEKIILKSFFETDSKMNKSSFFILGLSAISYSYKIIFAKIFGL